MFNAEKSMPTWVERLTILLRYAPALALLHSPVASSQIGSISTIDAPSVDNSACIDTAPFDDNYGWNGRCTCALDATLQGFGSVVSIKNNLAAIGSTESPQACEDSGTLSVYEYNNNQWQLSADLQPSNNSKGDRFPSKVFLSSDLIVAGAKVRPNSNNGSGPGKITTFARNANGQWQETHQIEHTFTPRSFLSAHPGLENAQYFANDADTLIANHGNDYFSRMLTTYSRNADNTWQEISSFTPENGIRIFDVSGNTLTVISGTALLVYEKDGSNWLQVAEFPVPRGHNAIAASGSLDIQGNTIIYSEGNRYQESFESTTIGKTTFTFTRNAAGDWTSTPIDQIAPFTMPPFCCSDFYTPNFTAEVTVSPTENSFIQMRDNWEKSFYSFDSFRSTGQAELHLFTFSDNKWSTTDTLVLSADQGYSNQIGYSAAYDGNNILLGTRDDNTVLFIEASASPSNDSTNENPAVAGCDYSNADNYSGWGWNTSTQESCPPLNEVSDPVATAECIDLDGDGYGWNGTETCNPDTTTTNENTSCDYSNADLYGGWGWNEAERQSCAPMVDNIGTQQPVTQCIDSDGDGYGWNGTETCNPSI